jgi:DNA-directed RNA polymerase subunit RPC12/RpoP
MSAITNLGSWRCPRCTSPYVYLSRYPGILERALRWLNMLPYRCGDCDEHYYFAEIPRVARDVRSHTV